MTTAVIFVAGPMPDLDAPDVADLGGEPEGIRSVGREARMSTLGERMRERISLLGPQFAVAADGGLDLALALGHEPQFVVGDMDSVSRPALQAARRSGSKVTEVPRAKDASDYELALDLAAEQGASHLLVIGGASGRLDHVFATVMTLTAAKYSGLVLEAWLVDNYVAVINGHGGAGGSAVATAPVSAGRSAARAVLDGLPGDQVSLFATNGPATGIRTRGLRWSLEDETLSGGTSRGVSNEMVDPTATIEITSGCLAIVKAGDAR